MTEPTFERVAIVGMGCVFPRARSIEELWGNICAGVDAITEAPAGRWDSVFYDPEAAADGGRVDRFYCRRGGFVDDVASFDPTSFGTMPLAVEGGEPDQFLALAQAAAALEDSGRADERAARDRVGVVVGRGGYRTSGIARLDQRTHVVQQLVEALQALLPDIEPARLEDVRQEFVQRLGPARPDASIGLVPNLTASRIANRLDFHGPAYTVDAACASTLVAADHAAHELARGRCDLMLAGGVHHCHDVTFWSVFTQLRALSPSQASRPFNRLADGLLIGEGTGFFVLKRLADAERDGDRIYAVICGSGVASGGRSSSLMSPDVGGQALAVERAWQSAGVAPDTVGLVEAHGTATPAGDQAELETLREVFGAPGRRAPRAGLGSIKSMIGHAMPAAGAAGMAKAALALHHRVLPPSLHAEEPHPMVEDTRFRLIHEAEPWDDGPRRVDGRSRRARGGPRRAGVNAFGFGGINAHVVLEEHPSSRQAPAAALPQRAPREALPDTADATSSRVAGPLPPTLLLAGEGPGRLAEQLDTWVAAHERGAGEPSITEAPEGGPARLAVVNADPRRLELAGKVIRQGRPWRGRSGVWFEPRGLLHGGQLAFVFPGVEPSFDPQVDDVARHFGLDSLGTGYHHLSTEMPDLERQARSIVAVGRLLHRALHQLGIIPDMVAGHSLGEWSASLAAGMVADTAIDEFLSRLQPGAVEVANVVYLALGCGVETAKELLAGLGHTAVSHDNCPQQAVACGPPDEIRVVTERCRARRLLTQELPFRSGFHSRTFAGHVRASRSAFASLPLQAPAVPLWSATTCQPAPSEPDGYRAVAERHLVEPVRFRELVLALHEARARVFVQVGVGSLTGFIEDTLRDREALAIAANSPKRSGLAQLCQLAAALWVEGQDVAFDRLATPDGATGRTSQRTDRGSRLDLGSRLVRDLTPLSSVPRDPVPAPGPKQRSMSGRDGQRATGAPAAADVRVSRRRFALDEEPAWADHALVRQPEDWPYPDDRFPLVPMTGIVQILMESASRLHPGLVPVAVEDVTAFRWLSVDPPRELTIRTAPQGATRHDPDGRWAERVKVTIDGHARATVVLASAYPIPPPISPDALVNERPSHIAAERFYAERFMFHGPAYQGVEKILTVADDGVRALLRTPEAPGALLDNAGQLMGVWLSSRPEHDRLVLPTSIQRVDLFGPHPAPGTLVDCTMVISDVTDEAVHADMTLGVDGRQWCRITGWQDRRFDTDAEVFEAFKWPEHNTLSADREGYTLVWERWPDAATRDLVMRRYLGRDERNEYGRHHPLAQREFLLGRIALKDAVRRWLWDRGHGPLFPGEIVVTNNHARRPLARGPYAADLRVSLAHHESVAVAMVAEGAEGLDVGIDIEQVEPRRADFERLALTRHERTLEPPEGYDRDTWLTCLWAVKEAAAKVTGPGLQGRPWDFEVTELQASAAWCSVADRRIAFERIDATPLPSGNSRKELIVAWTLINS